MAKSVLGLSEEDAKRLPKAEQEALQRKIELAIRLNPSLWLELHGAIEPKVGQLEKKPKANFLQRLINDVVSFCLTNALPCRILILKPRQKGSSTFSIAAAYRWLCNTRAVGCIIGGAYKQSARLFRMLKIYAENDTFEKKNRCKVIDRLARWANGSIMEQHTAGDPEAGRTGTYQVIVATEVARWAEEGVANAQDILAGLLKCVANAPMTLVILESTARGASGDFYSRWQSGISFDELKAGKDGYVKIFAPWFVFDDSRRDPKLEEDKEQCVPPDKIEDLRKQFDLDDWQIAWMQWSVREECKRDFGDFCQEYPFDPDSAFRTSGSRRFNSGMLDKMVQRSKLYPPEAGVLEMTEGWTGWRPSTDDEAFVLRWDGPPRQPLRFLLTIDVMKGATQVGGKDPDNHAALVWRAGYWDVNRGWVAPKVVACLVHDYGEWLRTKRYKLIWDIDILAERAWRLANYYGNCKIVVENNLDRGLIENLKIRGADLYMQEQFNKREQKTQNTIGWLTTDATREKAIETLARGVREYGTPGDGCEIYCPITLSEMQSFIQKDNGRSEAMNGKHDDTVLAAAIGLTVIESASTYSEPKIEVKLPYDLQLLINEDMQSEVGIAQRW